jgi:pimeloyl-[acyl-carrier protein] synthase
MAMNSDPSLDQRLVSPEIYSDPYPIYHQLREQDPVHWSDVWGCWVLTRYADVVTVLRDYRRFTNVGRIAAFLDQLPESVRAQIRPLYANFTTGMPNTDPPEHTRVRGLVNKAFSARVVESMRPRVQAIVDGLLDQAESGGSMEVIGDLAYPLPAIVIAETLGVPAADRDQFKAWSDDIVAFHGTGRPHIETIKKSTAALLETKAWLLQLIEARRRQPEDDLISALVAAEERGDMLNQTELVATCITLLTAGHETTTGLIGNGLLALLRHPDQLRKLRENPTMIGTAVEEFLRFDTSFLRAWRLTAEDVEIGGQPIPKGQTLSLMLGAANRDPAQFEDPDRLDITREPNLHTSFGWGIHFCAGAPLARREAEIAFTTLLRRFPRLELDEAGVEWQQNNTFHNLNSLPVIFQ